MQERGRVCVRMRVRARVHVCLQYRKSPRFGKLARSKNLPLAETELESQRALASATQPDPIFLPLRKPSRTFVQQGGRLPAGHDREPGA